MIAIYANASQQVGFGHIMRQIALIEEFVCRQVAVTVYSYEMTQELIDHITKVGAKFVKVDSVNIVEHLSRPDTLIIDDYNLSTPIFDKLRSSVNKLVLFDDNTYSNLPVFNLIINPSDVKTVTLKASQVLQGLDYRLIRANFKRFKESRTCELGCVFVTLGGSDTKQLSPFICQQLLQSPHVSKVIFAISSSCDSETLRLLKLLTRFAKFELHIDNSNIATLMSRADVAVTAAGGSLYELMYLGIPAIALVTAENQTQALYSTCNHLAYEALDLRSEENRGNIAKSALLLLNSVDNKQKLSAQAKKVVDGLAAKRICDAVLQLKDNEEINEKI